MIFRAQGKEYDQASAVEIVRALETDAAAYPHRGATLRRFLRWSLTLLEDRIPLRELDLDENLNDEKLSLSYLYLCDEYGLGQLETEPRAS